MLIDEGYRKSVAFIYVDELDKNSETVVRTPAASAVIVGVPIAEDKCVWYAVTNAHVISQCRAHGKAYLRCNLLAPEAHRDLPIDPDSWTCHLKTDVAVTRMPIVPDWDHLCVPFEMLASDEYVIRNRVGLGDEIFMVGLYSNLPGIERIQPVIRFGRLSMMPHEKVPIRLATGNAPVQRDAYLVEVRSMGGQSGSPAFIQYAADRENTGAGGSIKLTTAIPPALLGIVHGHFDKDQKVMWAGDVELVGNVKINTGMAIVIPAQAIIDVLGMEELVKERDELARQALVNTPITRDSALPQRE